MTVNVKNTMPNLLPNLIAPHYCISCEEIGELICYRCAHYITNDLIPQCLCCHKPLTISTMECASCQTAYGKQWVVGEMNDTLKGIVYAFKFGRNKSAAHSAAELLDRTLPRLPVGIHVTAVPTITPHIRQRGYDHAEEIAKHFAKIRRLPYQPLLRRKTTTQQLGKSRKVRVSQANDAFECRQPVSGTILLVDDVYTTGATAESAARCLKEGGATEVWLGVLAYQPLETPDKN